MKEDKLIDRVARRNPKTYDGSYDPMQLEESIIGVEKIFVLIEVPEEKSVNIGTFYLIGEAGISRNTIKDMLVGPKFTYEKFLEELRAKFYPVTIQ